MGLAYRGSHAGLVPGLKQAVQDPIVLPLRVAGVSRRAPQVGLLIATLLDFPVKVLQRVFTAWWGVNKQKQQTPSDQHGDIHPLAQAFLYHRAFLSAVLVM